MHRIQYLELNNYKTQGVYDTTHLKNARLEGGGDGVHVGIMGMNYSTQGLNDTPHLKIVRLIGFIRNYGHDYSTQRPSWGGKDGNPPDLATIFFETRKKCNKLVEPKAIEKYVHLAQLEEMFQADLPLPTIEIVEKCCGPQTRSHVFGFGGGVKEKDLKGETSSQAEFLSALRSTREDIKSLNEENKSLNEENKSLNDRLSIIEDEMKKIMKMKEFFTAQQSYVPPITSSFSTE
ncbi:hypothetical protein MTR67_024490 [Solanum verrucosum]|uniref:Uncharacterized protein n=1 Tax=Solanum verrucosum TaxID=315347 RepID=A0AAF0TYG6_SOLVR|nr:hypothetical protein MTR67_024490 [Solanum verrucosum]